MLAGLLASAALAGERGYLGVSLAVDTEGFFLNPTLNTVTVKKVLPDSPAARAGVEVADQIIEVEGHAVAGSKARALQPYLEREAGQTVKLKIRHRNGEVVALNLVAAARAHD